MAQQQVRLLGPIDIQIDGALQSVTGTRRKAVLAVLALAAGATVPADRIIDLVWSGDGPATAMNTLQSHISQLRKLFLSRDAIVAVAPGYRLELGDGDTTDVRAAERLVAAAERAGTVEERAAKLRSALALWRGNALAELDGIGWFDAQVERLERLRTKAFSALLDARLRLGEHVALVPELETLAREHPYDEALHGQLMLTLYRSGRQSDALSVYRTIRDRLRDDLGIDPGRALRDLETAMLRQDASLDPPLGPVAVAAVQVATAGRVPAPTVPAQLPSALAHLVGREPDLERLDGSLLAEPAGTMPGVAPAIAAISGPPGVGKTSLAVAWAHRVSARFPDGQLYLDLRGFSPQAAMTEAADALQTLLESLGVPAQRIPESREARIGLYRSTLAGKRVLVLLDNAHDADQVRPLLPGSPGCFTVITSRNTLASLVAVEGASAIPIAILAREEAHNLLTQRLGGKRVANEPDATDDIISRCAGLPLALAIVAARAATEPAVSLATFAKEMAAATGALDSLSGGDDSTDIRAVISWSYHQLSPEAAGLLRTMAMHPGGEIGLSAAASLGGVTRSRARRLLAELTAANL
ncbi:MAG TPA: BTAD domain-containing putative transcriptional regulator, partial [Micromonosporaceae bacterium]